MVPATLLGRLGLGETVDELMPAPGSSRGYRHGMIFETFMLTSCRRSTAGCWSDAQIVWRHSQRADASENRKGSSAATSAERACRLP